MSQWRTFAQLTHRPKSDVVVLLVTFVLTVVFDLTIAIELGLVLPACSHAPHGRGDAVVDFHQRD